MEKVTVVVPIYNAGDYLDTCIKSIQKQTYSNLEIILVNDGSKDRSGTICDNAAITDKRIKVFHNENKGVSFSRNFAILNAKGSFICFVDADDEISSNMIEVLYFNMKKYKTDIIICGHKSVYKKEQYRVVNHSPINFEGDIVTFFGQVEVFIESESIQGPCGKLFNLDIIKKTNIQFPIDMNYGEDTMFVYKYLEKCERVLTIVDILYSYNYVNEQSLSKNYKVDKMDVYIKLYGKLNEIIKQLSIPNKEEILKNKICIAAIYCINELYINNELKRADRIKSIGLILLKEQVTNSFFSSKNKNFKLALISLLLKKKKFKLLDILFFMNRLISEKRK